MQSASRQSLAQLSERLDQRARDTAEGELREALRSTADGLFAVAGLLDREVGLRRALSDPAGEADAKARVITDLLGDRLAGGATSVTTDAVRLRWSRPADLPEALARVGAQALFTVAQLDGRLDGVEDDLFRFARVVEREPELRRALSDRSRPADDRAALLRDVLDRARSGAAGEGDRADVTARLLESAVRDLRAGSVEAAADALARQAAARRQELVAVVTVARPLEEGQADRLSGGLRRLYGRAVSLQVEVDPDLLGGAVVRVGDEVVDGSVARRLEEAGRRLAG